MDSQQPDAKPQTHGTGSPAVTVRRVQPRKYPKPPGLVKRLVLLCLKPEAWPAAAQYPLWVTLVPLVVAILIAGTAIGVSESARFMQRVTTFATKYDARYPTYEINSDGVVSSKDPAASPMVLSNGVSALYVDPSGKTSLESIKEDSAILVTNHQVYTRLMGRDRAPEELKTFMPPLVPGKGQVTTINSASMLSFIRNEGSGMMLGAAVMNFGATVMGEAVWAALMMFLICPLVMVSAGVGKMPLMLPKRAAYRIAAAVLIPLILLSAFLQTIGHPVAGLLGQDRGQIFWFFAAAGLAIWAGTLAKKVFVGRGKEARRA